MNAQNTMGAEGRQAAQANQQLDFQPIPYSKLALLDQLLRFAGLGGRSKICRHRGSCIGSMLISTIRTGLAAYGIKTVMTIVFSLKKLLKEPSLLFQLLQQRASVNFGLFLATFILLFRSILCLARRSTDKDYDKYLFTLAGFIGGALSVKFLQKSARQALGLFLLARALDFTYHSLVQKKKIPPFKYFYVLLYSMGMVVTGYCYMNDIGSLSEETHNFYKIFSNETVDEMQLREIISGRKNIVLAKRGIAPQYAVDYIPKLKAHYEKLNSK